MTTTLAQLAADVKVVWAKVEAVAEADETVIATALKGLLTTIEPSLLSALVTIANDAVADLMDPASLATTLLGQAEAAGSALWNTLAPAAKSAVVGAIANIAAVNQAAIAPTAPATTPAQPAAS